MFAVIISGGKQHKVAEGDSLKVEKLAVEVGETITFDDVLMIGEGDDIKIGTPKLEKAKVTAEVVEQGRHKKIKIMKFRRRKHSQTETGHRQYYTKVRINSIQAA